MDENIRVSELAKELGLTSKEVIEKFAQISITVKSHSNSVTPLQIQNLKTLSPADQNYQVKNQRRLLLKRKKM